MPHLVLVEVAGAISRTRRAPARAQAFATALSRLPHVTVGVLDEVCALDALTLAVPSMDCVAPMQCMRR